MPLGVVPICVYFSLLLIGPLCLLVLYSFWKASFFAVDHTLTLNNYFRVLNSALYLHILLKTLGCSVLVSAISVIVGYAMAYAIVFRMKVWGPRILVLIMVTLLASYIVRLYAVTTILGTNGLLNQALIALGVITEPLTFLLYGYFAIVITLIYVYLPFAVLPIYAALQGIDKRLLEASRDLGCGALRTFLKVTLPLSIRGVRLAFAFCFILAAADYIAPRIVGGMNGQMIGAIIANQFGGASDYPFGAALSVSMIVGFAVVLGTIHGCGRLVAAISHRLPRRRLSNSATDGLRVLPTIPVSETVTIIALIFLFAPLLTVFVFSFNNTPNPGLPFNEFTLKWYIEIVNRVDFHRVLRTSLFVCAMAVAGGLIIGIPTALAMAKKNFLLKGLLGLLVFSPMAVPGVVMGVALLATFVTIGIRLGVATSIAAHILLVTPFIVLVTRAGIEKMDPRVEEAARDLGSSPARVFRTVTLPVLTPSLIGAAVLAAAISLDELLVTNFTIGSQATIPVWLSSQMRTGLTPAFNAVSVLVLAGSLALISSASFAIRLRRSMQLSAALGEAR